jgi:hypothetical protein
MKRLLKRAAWLALAGLAQSGLAAAITWQAVQNVAGDLGCVIPAPRPR